MAVEEGNTIKVEYVGTLDDGTEFDNSKKHGQPLEFKVGEGKVIAATTAVGAAGGAGMGALGARLELGNSVSETLRWQEPIIEDQVIGQIPEDHYHSAYSIVDESEVANRDVIAEGPRMEERRFRSDRVVMEDHSTTVSANPRFTMAGQALGGAVVGGIAGAAIGICFNVIRKIL